MLERQSTSVPKTSKTSARTATPAGYLSVASTGGVPDAALALARILLPAGGVAGLLGGHLLRRLALGRPLREVVRADLGVHLGRVAQRRLVVADDVRLGQPAFATVPECVPFVAAVARHLALAERAVGEGVDRHDDRDEGDRDGPRDPAGDRRDGRDDGEEDRREQEEWT